MCEPILVCTSTPHAESTNASITAIQYDAMRSIYYTISFCSVGRPTGLFYFCIIAKRTLSLYTRVSVCAWVFILNRKHCRIASPRFCLTALVYIVHRVLFGFFTFFVNHSLILCLSILHCGPIINVLREFMTLAHPIHCLKSRTNRYTHTLIVCAYLNDAVRICDFGTTNRIVG